MALYTATDSNEIQVKKGRSTKTIAQVPNDFMAALIRKHLNDPRGAGGCSMLTVCGEMS